MENQEKTIAFLLEEKMLDEQSLQVLTEQQAETGQSLTSILAKDNILSEDQLTKVMAVANGIEFVNLSPEMIDPEVIDKVPYKVVSRHNVIPIRIEGDKLILAMSSPTNLLVRNQIEMKTGCRIVPVAAMPNAIKQAIQYHFNIKNVAKETIASMNSNESDVKLSSGTDQVLESKLSDNDKASVNVGDAPITKLVSSIIRGAIDARASDVHIEPGDHDMKVRYRVDGLLQDALDVPSSAQLEVISHIKIMAGMDISERRLPQDGNMMVPHAGQKFDMRVSSLPAVSGEKIVIRILDKSTSKWELNKVVTSHEDNQKFRSLINNPYGMILMTGPTGSGKTTTLYTILRQLNRPEKNIVTVEDPIEYRLDGITQVQVNTSAGITFASVLRSILRQDPDIILIGEIRDRETAEIAISAAQTGHLVLSTLHTNDAAGAISRLINIGIPPFLVASALLGTVAQRLIRNCCPKCKQPYDPSQKELQMLLDKDSKSSDIQLYKATQCSGCYNTGYYGRKAVYEILPVSSQIRKLIVEHASDDAIKHQAVTEGMKTLNKSTAREVLEGQTTIDEWMRVVDVRDD
ncbi:GspE/PulE family protein [Planctomycetota bacterium]